MVISKHCISNERWVDVTESEDEDGNRTMMISVAVNCIYKFPMQSLPLASELIEEITMKELERVY